MTDAWLFYILYAVILATPLTLYLRRQVHRERSVKEATSRGEVFSEGPRGQHPHIDVSHCIGCQGCTTVCPEGQVLGMVGGKAAVIRPWRCIGHSLCADACPVGAITLVRAMPGISARLPFLTSQYETSVPNLFIVGELGGLALIRNAVQQGSECAEIVADRLLASPSRPDDIHDLLIVGAGPAGISAGLRSTERGLRYLVLEREQLGGTISKYPRQKLVMTTPITFPMYPTDRRRQLSKEQLSAFFSTVAARDDFHFRENHTVTNIEQTPDSSFLVTTSAGQYRSRAVILAMGRAGTPNKLGVPGEHLPKVMYRLIEADHYLGKKVLVVGGGDSAVEAAMGLALQKGNQVTISYRRSEFGRIKERNLQRLHAFVADKKIRVLFNSQVIAFTESNVQMTVDGAPLELDNDFAWIFAGGQAPDDFLRQIGVHFGPRDLTKDAVAEAAEAALINA